MGFFSKKRKAEKERLDESFKKVIDEINNIDDRDDPRKIEHYILESCEHIIGTAKGIDSSRVQYIKISEQLSDVDKIMAITPEDRASLKDLSENVYRLSKRKQVYKESDKRISDEEFMLLAEHEDSIVDDILKMENNEKYKSRIEGDLRYLEAEKSHFEIEKDYLLELIKRLRIASVVILLIIIGIICAWLVIPANITDNVRFGFITAIFIGVLAAFIILLIVGNKRQEMRGLIRKLNQNINLLNTQRMRFVNVSKALTYEMDVYDVRSSGELSYLWDQYLMTVKEQEAYRKNNLDLTYYLDRLYKVLKSLDLKFERKWVEQVDLMLNEEKMKELRDRLVDRKTTVKSQIEENTALIKEERDEIDKMMKEHNFYVGEVLEIINSVDVICGKTASALATIK